MDFKNYLYEVERIMNRGLSEAEVGYVEDCFNANWHIDRVVQTLNIEIVL
jgi:hypothetical protein